MAGKAAKPAKKGSKSTPAMPPTATLLPPPNDDSDDFEQLEDDSPAAKRAKTAENPDGDNAHGLTGLLRGFLERQETAMKEITALHTASIASIAESNKKVSEQLQSLSETLQQQHGAKKKRPADEMEVAEKKDSAGSQLVVRSLWILMWYHVY